MANGAVSPTAPEGYAEIDIDDTRSALYGAIGNLYNMMDSIPQAMAQKGLGRAYMEEGKTWIALRYLHKADEYFSSHEKEELTFTKENYEYMPEVLLAQRTQMMLIAGGAWESGDKVYWLLSIFLTLYFLVPRPMDSAYSVICVPC